LQIKYKLNKLKIKQILPIVMLILLGLSKINAQEPKNTYGLPYDKAKNTVIYTEVIPMPGATKDKLYERGMKCIELMYKNAKQKIAQNDKEAGIILLKCSTTVILKDKKGMEVQDGYVLYKFKLSLKEGKYKYEFMDIHRDNGGYKTPIEKWLNEVTPKEQPEVRFKLLDDDIKKAIAILKENMKADKVQVKEDW